MPELQLLGPEVHAPFRITQNTRSCSGIRKQFGIGPLGIERRVQGGQAAIHRNQGG
jgi:hypothetical protein